MWRLKDGSGSVNVITADSWATVVISDMENIEY
jgi:hypothetical protein